jgi:hypothetical protein
LSAAARDILHRLAGLGATVDRQGDKLILRAGTAPVPKDIMATIRYHKTEVLQALSADAERDDFEERAALLEAGAKVTLAWAAGFGGLDPDRPPAGVPLRRWRAVIDAIGTFLDRWAPEAAALGWQAADIFGADAARPDVTWLNAGPLWSGDGARVVEVHADRIIVETKGGARQSAYRRPHLRPRSLPWELT